MSAIFISHSSKDNDVAQQVADTLFNEGHDSLFLDVLPHQGISPGRDWERTLYDRLRRCRAVIAIISRNWMQSAWCQVEVTHARMFEKPVFPVKIARCLCPEEVEGPHNCDFGGLSDIQFADLTIDSQDGYNRLLHSLNVTFASRELMAWDPNEPPYPGLAAFQDYQAPIFFGRDEETESFHNKLRNLAHYRNHRLALILGASGSGKSSLLRAGLVPRLQRDNNLLVAGPFRPRSRPFAALAQALSPLIDGRSTRDIRNELRASIDSGSGDIDVEPILDLGFDILKAASNSDAAILLAIDQFEELLGMGQGEEAGRFLTFLRALLEADGPFLALGTIRSDFYSAFQSELALENLGHEVLSLGPMPLSRVPEIIEGPAKLADLKLEPGLVSRMARDTGSEDALPLLAFTLEKLYDKFGRDGDLTIDEYDRLGGLEGSVRQVADEVIAEITDQPWDEEEERALRGAFVKTARMDERGNFVRNPVSRTDLGELPPRVSAVLDRFVDRRLLVSGSVSDPTGAAEILEVAHEALYRQWPLLAGWLEEEQEYFAWSRRLRIAYDDWLRSGRRADALLRGSALEDALRWTQAKGEDTSEEQDFIALSRAWKRALDDFEIFRKLERSVEEVWNQPTDMDQRFAWCAQHGALVDRLPNHQHLLGQLGIADPPSREVSYVQELLKSLKGMQATGHSAAAWSKAMRFEARPQHDAAWDEAIEAIQCSPLYGGLRLTRQEELVPLGQDADSGLWEFAHVLSGDIPEWHDGHVVRSPTMAIVLVLIPGGLFWMGAQTEGEHNVDPDAIDDNAPDDLPENWAREVPVHEVNVQSFFIGKYPVTQGQWQNLTGESASAWEAESLEEALLPIETVAWNDVVKVSHAVWLRLPSESEWEYAARAGDEGPHSFSEVEGDPDDYMWYSGNSDERTQLVGELLPNRFGLYDVHGNVWEWCQDEMHESYDDSDRPDDGTAWQDSAEDYALRCSRGGGYGHDVEECGSARRYFEMPTNTLSDTGFRAARDLD